MHDESGLLEEGEATPDQMHAMDAFLAYKKANGWDPNEEAVAELDAPADSSVSVSEEDTISSQDRACQKAFFALIRNRPQRPSLCQSRVGTKREPTRAQRRMANEEGGQKNTFPSSDVLLREKEVGCGWHCIKLRLVRPFGRFKALLRYLVPKLLAGKEGSTWIRALAMLRGLLFRGAWRLIYGPPRRPTGS